ncbi:MAG: hybrid sensor histidine kinase/response regulator [Sulfurimonas sp.]|nr:hybrid sensor histidine kinase/response regulator [Sulfurimonas sp.]
MIINILTVDDKEKNLFLLESLLQELKFDNKEVEGIHILKALSGEEALKIAMDRDIDLIILDIKMPGMNGFETAKFLKLNHKTKNIPIIFLTAVLKAEEFVKQGFELGAIDYFIKPVEKYQFLNKISLYIELFVKNKKLNYLNKNLKKEVEKEIEKNKDKEEIMIAQSRHAAMGEMIGMIAHQWRQPISVIAMGANNLLVDIELHEVSEENIIKESQNILKQTKYLSKTIDDFRNFFRPNKEIEEISLAEVINEAKLILGKSLEYSQVELSIKHENIHKVKTYSRELLQVYINLLKNAQEALIENTEKDRRIDILVSIDTDNVITTICDNGGGIDESIIEKIFDPYFSTKDEKIGTGLGLYMSKTIIEKHLHGSLKVYNTKGGACFKLSIPMEWKGMLNND